MNSTSDFYLPKGFGARLQRLMDEKDVSMSALARGIGITFPAVNSLLKDRTKDPRWSTIAKIASFFDVPIRDLMEDRPVPRTEDEELAELALRKSAPKIYKGNTVPLLHFGVLSELKITDWSIESDDWVVAPPGCTSEQVVAFYLRGSFLAPDYLDEDLLFLHRKLVPPEESGEYCGDDRDRPLEGQLIAALVKTKKFGTRTLIGFYETDFIGRELVRIRKDPIGEGLVYECAEYIGDITFVSRRIR
ncbi:helix-turn-helix transcriptional regulator [Parasutterella excrementihominis]|jgi:transcriptional regulator with XRE-family HTH domain|uniref:helix-turn-helix domain-containing protein n=1 Tax=Parasutterella excrementihominis TaxID=487175 RepID=UPI003076DE3B